MPIKYQHISTIKGKGVNFKEQMYLLKSKEELWSFFLPKDMVIFIVLKAIQYSHVAVEMAIYSYIQII